VTQPANLHRQINTALKAILQEKGLVTAVTGLRANSLGPATGPTAMALYIAKRLIDPDEEILPDLLGTDFFINANTHPRTYLDTLQHRESPILQQRTFEAIGEAVRSGLLKASVAGATQKAAMELPRSLFMPGFYAERDIYGSLSLLFRYAQFSATYQENIKLWGGLGIEPGQRFLDMGTGTSWIAALASSIVGARGIVHCVDINQHNIEVSQRRFNVLGITNAVFKTSACKDFDNGAETYDRIFVSFEPREGQAPPHLLKQLKIGGQMVISFLNEDDLILRYFRYTRISNNDYQVEALFEVERTEFSPERV
jgi:protein-L-isoaspartate O-methyltransferase